MSELHIQVSLCTCKHDTKVNSDTYQLFVSNLLLLFQFEVLGVRQDGLSCDVVRCH